MLGLRKVDIIIFSDRAGRVVQIRLPALLLRFGLGLLLLFSFIFGYFAYHYAIVKVKAPLIAKIKTDYAKQQNQFLALTHQAMEMAREVNNFRDRNPWVEIGRNVEERGLSRDSDPDLSGPPLLATENAFHARMPNLARLLFHYLDGIEYQLNTAGFVLADKEGIANGDVSDLKKTHEIRRLLTNQALNIGLNPRLAIGMAKVESGFNPKKVSPKGAIGVLQIMPKFVIDEYGITRKMLFDPKENIRIGLTQMKALLKRFDNNLDLSLAAYNAGASRVVKAGYRVPDIKETRTYVRKVKEAMKDIYIPLYAAN